MTKTTEELKREMYRELEHLKSTTAGTAYTIAAAGVEESLEAYLEALRKAMVTINESTVSCAQHSAEAFLDLEARLARMTEERDTIRNKLQAFEFANRSAAELLSEALREPSGLRKSQQAIPQQESDDLRSCGACRTSDTLDYPSNVVPIFKLIRENTEYTLTSEQFEAFELILQNKPASENKALQDLLNRKPGWGDGDQS